MTSDEIKRFQQKWKAIHAIEQKELRRLSVKDKFDQLVSLFRLAKGLGLSSRERRTASVHPSNWLRLKKMIQ